MSKAEAIKIPGLSLLAKLPSNEPLKQYQCHKKVHAKPMTRAEYNEYRRWIMPINEDGSDPGYLVIYNKDTDDHYESWSPKHVFDDGYSEVKPISKRKAKSSSVSEDDSNV